MVFAFHVSSVFYSCVFAVGVVFLGGISSKFEPSGVDFKVRGGTDAYPSAKQQGPSELKVAESQLEHQRLASAASKLIHPRFAGYL